MSTALPSRQRYVYAMLIQPFSNLMWRRRKCKLATSSEEMTLTSQTSQTMVRTYPALLTLFAVLVSLLCSAVPSDNERAVTRRSSVAESSAEDSGDEYVQQQQQQRAPPPRKKRRTRRRADPDEGGTHRPRKQKQSRPQITEEELAALPEEEGVYLSPLPVSFLPLGGMLTHVRSEKDPPRDADGRVAQAEEVCAPRKA